MIPMPFAAWGAGPDPVVAHDVVIFQQLLHRFSAVQGFDRSGPMGIEGAVYAFVGEAGRTPDVRLRQGGNLRAHIDSRQQSYQFHRVRDPVPGEETIYDHRSMASEKYDSYPSVATSAGGEVFRLSMARRFPS